MEWLCCCMKIEATELSKFGVCVNFKIRTLYGSAVQLCGDLELGRGGGVKDSYCNLLLAVVSA